MSHYEILGVAPSADVAHIRDAYRRLAREHHPDRHASTASSDSAMAAINEAYRVLADPARRAVYDAGLRSSASQREPPREHTGSPRPGLGEPGCLPWRPLLFFGAIAIVGVVALSQFTEPPAPRGPDGVIEIGSCVSIEPNGDAREVACVDDPAVDRVVEAFVPFDAHCPTGTEAHRDHQGMGVACVTLFDET